MDDNKQDIDILLKTTADTTGAEDTKKAISDVDKAAQEAQRDQDVATAKQRQATRAAKEQAEALREIADGQQRLIAANLADAIGKMSAQFRGLSPEIDMAIGSTQTFLSVLASTGNPVAALLAMTGSAISSLVDAEKSAAAMIKGAEKDIVKAHEKMREARAVWVQQVRTENLQQFFKKELDMLELQEAALGRIFQIREKERGLEAARQRAAGQAAVRGGIDPFAAQDADSARRSARPTEMAPTDPFAAQAADLATEQTNAIKEVQDSLTESSRQLGIAQEKALRLKGEADNLAAINGEGADVAVAAAKEAEAAAKNATKLAEALPDLQRMAQIDIATIQEETRSKIADLNEQAGRALAKSADEEISKLRSRAEDNGQTISAAMEGIIAQISKATQDGLVESKELPAFIDQLNRVRGVREGNDAKLMEGMDALLRTTTVMASRLPSILSDIKRLEAEVQQIRDTPK